MRKLKKALDYSEFRDRYFRSSSLVTLFPHTTSSMFFGYMFVSFQTGIHQKLNSLYPGVQRPQQETTHLPLPTSPSLFLL
jgi:hypothetical protein